jgi:hypothetical protein
MRGPESSGVSAFSYAGALTHTLCRGSSPPFFSSALEFPRAGSGGSLEGSRPFCYLTPNVSRAEEVNGRCITSSVSC